MVMIRSRSMTVGCAIMKKAWVPVLLLLAFNAPSHAQSDHGNFKDCADCPEMVVIPQSLQGADKIKPFALGKYEVTQAQWLAVMGDRPSEFVGDNLPVETVSWNDVQAFIRKLNAKTGKQHRLPTGAEWEYAARAGSTTAYSYGDDASELGKYSWFLDNAGETTHPVGQKLPNAFGLYDTHGNVWEWVQDCMSDAASGTGPKVDEAVVKYIRDCHRSYRGGSMANKSSSLKLTYSQSGGVNDRYFAMGFRIARSLP